MAEPRAHNTAGRGDPYWYEWFVGLIEVVDLIDQDSKIKSVAFQLEGVKGWDDVVVRLWDGRRRCYQVKHTRADDSLTFGDLVQHDDNGESLLRSLFQSWRGAGLNDGVTKCILYTNREAGERWATTKAGDRRSPLLSFYQWLRGTVDSVKSLDDLKPPSEFEGSWQLWVAELSPGSDDDRMAFLRALEIRAKQDDLNGLEGRIRNKLARTFGVSLEKSAPLFNSLCAALRKWTTGHPGVTIEELFAELAMAPEPRQLAPAPPPPSPFFPTRVPVANELERLLQDGSAEPVIFLTAEPGAGKTSVLSWLANRRDDQPFAGLIGARFFCFEPIRPENPIIAPDASRVRPEELWGSLLAQLREGLRGRLHELQVPLRNDLLTWQGCREHALRLARRIGQERGQPFVIVIDGIDHAARAGQTMPQQIADFFASLPGPSELPTSELRLLIAGQPPEHYAQQYPAWLVGPHPQVRRTNLPGLLNDDVRVLYRTSQSKIPVEQAEEAVRVIEEHAKGNTLATVFAVAESERASNVVDFAEVLRKRRLADGLATYYASIWSLMLETAGDARQGIDLCLTGVFALAQRGVRAELFVNTFGEWGKPLGWWRTVLDALGPLLKEGPDGFRVRHNDIRVFLTARFSGFDEGQRRRVASQLADHLVRPESDRLAAHRQVFDLLEMSGRSGEAAKHFTVDWVFEAATLGIDNDRLMREAELAIRSLPLHRDWSKVVSVACATQTLERLRELREYSESTIPIADKELPPFFPTEARVRSVRQWSTSDLHAVVSDAIELADHGQNDRARSLLDRWFGGVSICDLVGRFSDSIEQRRASDGGERRLEDSARSAFERLGHIAAVLEWVILPGDPLSDIQQQALVAFERGFVKSVSITPNLAEFDELFSCYEPRYLFGCEELLRRCVSAWRWDLVRDGLNLLVSCREKFPATLQADATWWALCSGAAAESAAWLIPLELDDYGLNRLDTDVFSYVEHDEQVVSAMLNISRAIGWQRVGLDARDIAETVFGTYKRSTHVSEVSVPTRLILRAAATIGRIAAAKARGGAEEIRTLVTPAQIGELLSLLWGDVIMKSHHMFNHRKIAAELARELSAYCGDLGDEYEVAAVRAAKPIAAKYPIDFRWSGVWSVLERNGEKDTLRSWVRYWLAKNGEAWRLSKDYLFETVESLVPLAERLGEKDMTVAARDRLKWLQIGYRSEKENAFEGVLSWFRQASSRSPAIWRGLGWKLWCICQEVDAQAGSNQVESGILDAISAAAIRCGATDWWQLFGSTLSRINQTGWHDDIRQRFVDGAEMAILQGGDFSPDDVLVIWCLALCFSLWTDPGDNASLSDLREGIQTLRNGLEKNLPTRLAAISSRYTNVERRVSVLSNDDPIDEKMTAGPQADRVESTIERAIQGDEISLSEAASAVEKLVSGGGQEVDGQIHKVLGAVGTSEKHCTPWSHAENMTDESLARIVRLAPSDGSWSLVQAVCRDFDRSLSWTWSIPENLLKIALARACGCSVDDLIAGVEMQVEMHARWALGGDRNTNDLPPPPVVEGLLSWRDVAVRTLPLLLESYSAEVLGAALEGMHALVAHDPSVMPDLFARIVSRWPRRWLLSAAESWAALHPDALDAARGELEQEMNEGDLDMRLQAWIVLCGLSDALHRQRPEFPMPKTADGPRRIEIAGAPAILHTEPTRLGASQFVDRFASVRSKLRRLSSCGFRFEPLESVIAERLAANSNRCDVGTGRQGPARRNSFFCTNLDEERVVGDAVGSVLSSDWCTQEILTRFAQGFLSNEDAWMQRTPPRPSRRLDEWPNKDEYGAESIDQRQVEESLTELAKNLELPKGWNTFAADTFSCNSKEDFVLHLWWEASPDLFLVRNSPVPTCTSGRSFLWWLADFVEHETSNERFDSGFFVGGMQRLNRCNFEIHPAKAWRELGWEPDLRDPMTWYRNGQAVARYERIHGPLRNNHQSPVYRQPVLERWIISDEAFEQVQRIHGHLTRKVDFQVYAFDTKDL